MPTIVITAVEPGAEREPAAVLLEAVHWLNAKGEPLWTPEQVSVERLAPHARAGELHAARRDGRCVGAFLLQWEDRFAWPDVPEGDSAFIHKLAVTRDAAGSGVAQAIIEWAAQLATARGRRFLRLDCAPRPRLCAIYESAGFRLHSERQGGCYTLIRFEMPLPREGPPMSDTKQQLWGREYVQRRAQGHPGWNAATEYERKQARLAAAFERHAVRAGDRLLELGSGAGNITLWASGFGLRATGIDFVPDAVAWARERAGPDSVASFVQGDITDMKAFTDGSFDAAFDSDCLHMIFEPGRSACLAEVRRVLRPGGLFLLGGNVAKPGLSGGVPMPFGHYDADQQVIYVGDRPEYQLRTQDGLVAEIETAGFEVLRVERLPPRGGQPFIDACVEIDARSRLA